VIDVGPDRRGDHADVPQPGRQLISYIDEFSADVAIEEAAGRLRVTAGHDPSADKDALPPAAVEIRRRDGSGAFALRRQCALGSKVKRP